jgi:hypothetical protein
MSASKYWHLLTQNLKYISSTVAHLLGLSGAAGRPKYLDINVGARLVNWPERMRIVIDMLLSLSDYRIIKILDLGCGHQAIRHHIPAGSEYYPVDNQKRSPDTIVMDLDHEFPVGQFDVTLAIGVLEYLDDPLKILHQLLKQTRFAIVSYNFTERARVRRNNGWRNFMSLEDFERLVYSAGFSTRQRVEVKSKQYVFLLDRLHE